jgi:hypothetical protein
MNTKTEHTCDQNCRICDGCKTCLYIAHYTQDVEAALEHGLPIFICKKCGARNFWD